LLQGKTYLWILIILFFTVGQAAQAGLIFDNHLFYSNVTTKTTLSESQSRYGASFFLGASISKLYFIGWKTTVFSDSKTDSAGTAKISGLEMGPRLGVFLDKSHWWALAANYLPVHSATYTSDTGTVSKLTGSGYEFELCFAPQVFNHLSPGVSLLYHLGSYSSSTDAANTTSTVSYSRSGFTPSVYLHWVFGGLD
jgi:hypothetical protein